MALRPSPALWPVVTGHKGHYGVKEWCQQGVGAYLNQRIPRSCYTKAFYRTRFAVPTRHGISGICTYCCLRACSGTLYKIPPLP